MPGGSSPLTRGKQSMMRFTVRTLRLIPAHAGKTFHPRASPPPGSAHPRSRGENVEDAQAGDLVCGSSPLTRGKQGRPMPDNMEDRLIPAHAGKTATVRVVIRSLRAHPRSRGENVAWTGIVPSRRGSSPLTRGKPTPSPSPPKPERAHPRSRGENTSSHQSIRPVGWLIPAHAGKTSTKCAGSELAWAHPRSRGENFDNTGKDLPFVGSSPLTRGKRFSAPGHHSFVGLIPAHAGKTRCHQ